jgi:hypothetical protein
MKIIYVNDYTLSMSIVYALIIWRWTSRRIIDFVKIINSFVSRMSWDHINSFIKTDRNLFWILQRFRSTYLLNNDVNDLRQIIWCCRDYSINDLIKKFRCLSARNIILRRSFWKNLKCINIICDESINAKTTIDYETCFILSINNWCDRIRCIIDDTWDCDSINVENWSVIHITRNMSWRETTFFSSHRSEFFKINLVRTRRQHDSRHLIFEWRRYQQLYCHSFWHASSSVVLMKTNDQSRLNIE